FSPRWGALALPVVTCLASPGWAQESQCAHLDGAEEVACLKEALAWAQEALARAESALQDDEPPLEAQAAASGRAELGAEQAARRTSAPAPQAAEEQRIIATVALAVRVHPNRLQ